MQEDIFDLAVSEQEGEIIKKMSELEAEIISDFIAEFKDFRFIGPLIKIGKIGVNYCVGLSEMSNHITDNLSACGLLSNRMHDRVENKILIMSTVYTLNNIGQILYNILNESGWF